MRVDLVRMPGGAEGAAESQMAKIQANGLSGFQGRALPLGKNILVVYAVTLNQRETACLGVGFKISSALSSTRYAANSSNGLSCPGLRETGWFLSAFKYIPLSG